MNSDDIFPIHQSNLFQEWQLEKIEIEKLRQKLAAESGTEIDWDRAYWVWVTRHRNAWRTGVR